MKLVEAYFGQHRTFSGVLQVALRVKRGFNYGNYAYAEYFEQDGWARIPKTNMSRYKQHFSIWIRPVKDADKHFVLRLVMSELEKLVKDGLTEEKLNKTRTFMKRYYRTFAQTEQRALGYALDDSFYGQETPYFEKLFADLDELTVEDVNAAIRKYMSYEDLYIAAVTRDAEKFADALAADEPSPVTYTADKPKGILAEDKLVSEKKLGISRDAIQIIPVDEIFK